MRHSQHTIVFSGGYPGLSAAINVCVCVSRNGFVKMAQMRRLRRASPPESWAHGPATAVSILTLFQGLFRVPEWGGVGVGAACRPRVSARPHRTRADGTASQMTEYAKMLVRAPALFAPSR